MNDIVRRSLFRKNVHPLKYSRCFASPRENICATRVRVVGHPMRVPTRSDPLFPVIQTRRYPVILRVTSNIFLSVNSANNRSVFRLSGDTRRADPDRIHRSRKTLVQPYPPYRIAEKQQHATDTRCGFWKDAARWHRCSCGTDTESFSGRAGVH